MPYPAIARRGPNSSESRHDERIMLVTLRGQQKALQKRPTHAMIQAVRISILPVSPLGCCGSRRDAS